MQIRLKCNCDSIDCKEWAIIEIQGVIESQPSIGTQIQSLEIGRLCCTDQGSYTMVVGYHELSGTKTLLKKPVLVLKKTQVLEEGDSMVELEVVGIIRQKILFKNRPKAIISRVLPKEKKEVQAS